MHEASANAESQKKIYCTQPYPTLQKAISESNNEYNLFFIKNCLIFTTIFTILSLLMSTIIKLMCVVHIVSETMLGDLHQQLSTPLEIDSIMCDILH